MAQEEENALTTLEQTTEIVPAIDTKADTPGQAKTDKPAGLDKIVGQLMNVFWGVVLIGCGAVVFCTVASKGYSHTIVALLAMITLFILGRGRLYAVIVALCFAAMVALPVLGHDIPPALSASLLALMGLCMIVSGMTRCGQILEPAPVAVPVTADVTAPPPVQPTAETKGSRKTSDKTPLLPAHEDKPNRSARSSKSG